MSERARDREREWRGKKKERIKSTLGLEGDKWQKQRPSYEPIIMLEVCLDFWVYNPLIHPAPSNKMLPTDERPAIFLWLHYWAVLRCVLCLQGCPEIDCTKCTWWETYPLLTVKKKKKKRCTQKYARVSYISPLHTYRDGCNYVTSVLFGLHGLSSYVKQHKV